MVFDGETYNPQHDLKRLKSQLARVQRFMERGRWQTLGEIADAIGGSEAGVSARLRDLRKPKFGGWAVERRHRGTAERGLYEYRVVPGSGGAP